MKDFFFHADKDGDTGEFVNSLGDFYQSVLEDCVIIANFGSDVLGCGRIEHGIWHYERALGGGRRVIFLFDFVEACDAYIVLHAFRAGPEGMTRGDLQVARRRRRTYP